MRGAVAGGHPLTAEAGARALAAGGNAVDAAVAAGFASWAAESPLTGPGAGGFMLVHRARDRSTRVLDFFVAAPGLGLDGPTLGEMDSVDVDFSGGSTQVFRIGPASCAVPGAAAGMEAAHRAYGRLPWAELARPAARLAREGVELTRAQAYLHAILDVILRHTPEGRELYGSESRLGAGERLRLPGLADTIELLAERGAGDLYHGDLAAAIVRHVREGGGTITAEDLASYRVVRRRPVDVSFRGHRFLSNPPPAAGGVLIGYGLKVLDTLGVVAPAGSAAAIDALARAMRAQTEARDGEFAQRLYRGGLAGRLLAVSSGTTHVSAVDAEGNVAALTASTGAGSGVVVPGTGIHLNNMLGEFDLAHYGGRFVPGRRLSSMMSPSLVVHEGRPRLVVGSAGSLRLRSAILQVIVNVVHHGLPVGEAIERPRVHLEGEHLHCEGGNEPAELDRLDELGWEVVRWRRRNLFFGGVAAVEERDDGALAAAGDPRRGGHGVVV
jgi:gamma-glutamyltranspeptidase / glutathione hydrolase